MNWFERPLSDFHHDEEIRSILVNMGLGMVILFLILIICSCIKRLVWNDGIIDK